MGVVDLHPLPADEDLPATFSPEMCNALRDLLTAIRHSDPRRRRSHEAAIREALNARTEMDTAAQSV